MKAFPHEGERTSYNQLQVFKLWEKRPASARAFSATRSVEKDIPTRERGNENQTGATKEGDNMRDPHRVMTTVLALSLSIAAGVVRAQDPARPARKFGLLVGVREYKTTALRPLKYSERDIEELARVLVDSGFDEQNLRILTQERAAKGLRHLPTSDNIRSELARMLTLVELDDNPADTVIVALAGHGIMDPKIEASYFCPADTSAANLSPDDPALIDLGKLYDRLKSSKGGFKLLLVDACRNDPLNPTRSVRPVVDLQSVTRPFKKRPPGGVAALFSCSEGQVAYEDDDLKHGVFFHFVIEGWKGKADQEAGNRDGKLTLGELASYTSTEVFKYVDRTRNDSQLPEYLFKANAVTLADVALVKPAVVDKTITNSIGMKLTLIPAGQFLMGSAPNDKEVDDDEKPWHWVRITQPFYLGTHELTRGQFRRFVDDAAYQTEAEKDGKGGYGWNEETKKFEQNARYNWQNPGFDHQTDEHPVVNVSWNDAQAFVSWLSRKEGKTYRLPTEAEWEFACRAGSKTRYSFGDDPEGLAEVGNIADGTAKEKYPDWTGIAARDGYVCTAPVRRFRPNAWGLYDMHGNVWEWCSDGYDMNYYKQSPMDDPMGALRASLRVCRGGGWSGNPRSARSASRGWYEPGDRHGLLGFRVALVQSVR
jgi:formylglycine-generating enzyme required for sulfatase activity